MKMTQPKKDYLLGLGPFCQNIGATVGEPEWGGRSSAGAEWMRTDEGDSIDKRVKEMWIEREDSSSFFQRSFSPSVMF